MKKSLKKISLYLAASLIGAIALGGSIYLANQTPAEEAEASITMVETINAENFPELD